MSGSTLAVSIDTTGAKAGEEQFKQSVDAMRAAAAEMRKGIEDATASLATFRQAAEQSTGARIAEQMKLAREGLMGVSAASKDVVENFKLVEAEGARLARLRGDLAVAQSGKSGGDFGARQMQLASAEASLLAGSLRAVGIAEKVAADAAQAAAAAEVEAARAAAAAKVQAAERVALANRASLETIHGLANQAASAMAKIDRAATESAGIVGAEARASGSAIAENFTAGTSKAKAALASLGTAATEVLTTIKAKAGEAGTSVGTALAGGIGQGRLSWLTRALEAKTFNQALRDMAHSWQPVILGVIAYSAVHQTLKFAEAAENAEHLNTRLHSLGTSFEALEPAAHALGMSVEKSVKTFEALNEPIVAMGGNGKLATQVMADLAMQLANAGVHGKDAEERIGRFGQVLANGFVSGRQFEKSLRDIPGLLQQLTSATGMSEQALKSAFVNQRMQSNVMVQAIVADQVRIQDEFNKSPKTLASATAEMGDSWSKMLARWAASPGAMQPLVSMIERFTHWLDSSDATERLTAIANGVAYLGQKAMDFAEWLSAASDRSAQQAAKQRELDKQSAADVASAWTSAKDKVSDFFDGLMMRAVSASATLAAFGNALLSLGSLDGAKIAEAFDAIGVAGDAAVTNWRRANEEQLALTNQAEVTRQTQEAINILLGLQAGAVDMVNEAQTRLLGTLAQQLAVSSGIMKAQATSGAASGLKGIGEKKAGGVKGADSAQQKLDVLKEQNTVMQTQLQGDLQSSHYAQLELDIRKQVTVAMKKNQPELAAQIEAQMRLNDTLKLQLETYQALKGLGTQIGNDVSAAFMSIGDGTKKASDAMKELAVNIIKAIVQATILKPLINQLSSGFAGALTPLFGTSLSSIGGGLLGSNGGGAASITAAGTSFAATVQGAATSFAATLTGGSTTAGTTLAASGTTAGASLTAGGATSGAALSAGGTTASTELVSGGAAAASELEAGAATGGASTGGLGSLFSGLFNANGNAFGSSGQITAFANGGVFNSPTGFQFGGGKLGVLGEAGPEAIMPLRRSASGSLGVVAHGAHGSSVLPLVRGADGKMAVKMFASGGMFTGSGEASLSSPSGYSEASLSTGPSDKRTGGNVVNFAPVFNVAGDMTDATAQRLAAQMKQIAAETFKDGIAKTAPQIISHSVNAVQAKNRSDRSFLARR